MGSSTNNEALWKEIEVELKDVGKRLLRFPSSTDVLLLLLEEAEIILARVWQGIPSSKAGALFSLMKALISDELLRHADLNIKLQLHLEIFQLFMVALKQLSTESGSNYARAVQILEALATLRSCMIMLDIEIDAMIVEMFQLFFDTIR
ncbi:hypothetical protein DH2020_038370 [Rehmannia glutinosa]|uniref:Uncharacterized protein n=1 Tax=Rehmannia glutinosa TaxID=99300 RepID=A0ABR0UZH5_REHGL